MKGCVENLIEFKDFHVEKESVNLFRLTNTFSENIGNEEISIIYEKRPNPKKKWSSHFCLTELDISKKVHMTNMFRESRRESKKKKEKLNWWVKN